MACPLLRGFTVASIEIPDDAQVNVDFYQSIILQNGAISIKIYLKFIYSYTTYFAVPVSRSELKPTRTFTVMHEKSSP